MKLLRFAVLAIALLFATTPAFAASAPAVASQRPVDNQGRSTDPSFVIPINPDSSPGGSQYQPTYSLLANATVTGAFVGPVFGASYLWSCVASNWNGATATLQVLGPDAATVLAVTTMTANNTIGVVIGSSYGVNVANVRVAISVAVPVGVYCNLS